MYECRPYGYNLHGRGVAQYTISNHNLTGPTKKKLRDIVAHYRGQKPIIMAHDRISHPEKNYDRKKLTYRWSYLPRKKL